MSDRRTLMATGGVSSGLLDSAGTPMPASTMKLDIAALPRIERAALPGLPHDMEGRLLHVEGSPDDPVVVLFHARSELHMLVPLTDLANLPAYVEALNGARLKQAMAEAPDGGEGYRVHAVE